MHNQFSKQLKQLRTDLGYSMQQLADRANVSKSMISKIERDEVQPTLDVATRLAQALGKSLSAMLETQTPDVALKIPLAEQSIWEDPVTHLSRRILSPSFPGAHIEWIEVILPGQTELNLSPLKKGSEKYFLLVEGSLDIRVGEKLLCFQAGDSGYLIADQPHTFINPASQPVRYLLVITH